MPCANSYGGLPAVCLAVPWVGGNRGANAARFCLLGKKRQS